MAPNSYMLPHGTRPGGEPAQHQRAEVQQRAEHDQRDRHAAEPLGPARRRPAGRVLVRARLVQPHGGRAGADQLALGGGLRAAAERLLDEGEQQREDVHADGRGVGPVAVAWTTSRRPASGLPPRGDVLLGGSSSPSSGASSARRSAANRRNSSPYPAWSVRARPPSRTTVRPSAPSPVAGVARTHSRRRLTTSEVPRPSTSAIAKPSTHTCAGSWDTCRYTQRCTPSKRTFVPSSSSSCLARPQVLPRHPIEAPAVHHGLVDLEDRLAAAGLVAEVAAQHVDRDGRVVQVREAGREHAVVHHRGRREQAGDRELLACAARPGR